MPPRPRVRTHRLAVRVTPELHEQIKRLAESEHRTVSNWIESRLATLVAEAAAPPRKRG